MSWCRRIGCATSRVSPSRPAIGSVHTSWCCTATSGIGTPAIAPTVGPQIPAHSRTRSHSTSPRSVRTPCTRPSRTSNPVTATPPSNATPFASARRPSAVAMGTALAMPSDGTWYAPRIVEGSRSGIFSAVSAGVSSSAPSSPNERANPSRRFSSRIRASVVATSIPPTPYQAGSPSMSKRRVQRDRLLGDPAHHPGAVGLEREPGRVRARAPGLEQRTLVEHEHVALAELGQVVGGARADDPGADDDGSSPLPHQASDVPSRAPS